MRRLLYSPVLVLALFRGPWAIVIEDVRWWCECLGSPYLGLTSFFQQFQKPEFRSLFYHRLRHGNGASRMAARIASIFYRPEPTCRLWTDDIGPGLYIAHGIATMIGARKIGRHCWLNQQISVGYSDRGEGPILEDGVRIYAGAKVLGPITIGRNTRIGANAVVLKDSPPDCVLAGVPARIIRRNGQRVDEPL
jgi:serine O-acetyltransferase